MLAGFKKFILQGNVVDLAVGVVIGAAFGTLITQFTASFIEPLLKLILGGGVDGGIVYVDRVAFNIGAFINAIITFAMTAAVIYFVVVMPMNLLKEKRAKGEEAEVEPSNEEKMLILLQQIANK